MTLTKSDWGIIEKFLDKSTNKDLYKILEKVEYEIKLSEECIKEGTEKRR